MSDTIENIDDKTSTSKKQCTDIKSEIDKIDILILHYMYTYDKKDALYSVKIKEIHDYVLHIQNIAYYTTVRRIKKLEKLEYVIKGYKIGNAYTYYLSDRGVHYLENNVLNKDSAYKYIPDKSEEEK